MLARLGGDAASGPSKAERKVLDVLADVRRRAHTHSHLQLLPSLVMDPSLSNGALLHARYLAKHPKQLALWPDAHEEFTDREGFTPEGSWAGAHSVIHPGSRGPKDAIDGWTFDATNWFIRFHGDAVPRFGSIIEATYAIACGDCEPGGSG